MQVPHPQATTVNTLAPPFNYVEQLGVHDGGRWLFRKPTYKVNDGIGECIAVNLIDLKQSDKQISKYIFLRFLFDERIKETYMYRFSDVDLFSKM